jgi:hypothetical protein
MVALATGAACAVSLINGVSAHAATICANDFKNVLLSNLDPHLFVQERVLRPHVENARDGGGDPAHQGSFCRPLSDLLPSH